MLNTVLLSLFPLPVLADVSKSWRHVPPEEVRVRENVGRDEFVPGQADFDYSRKYENFYGNEKSPDGGWGAAWLNDIFIEATIERQAYTRKNNSKPCWRKPCKPTPPPDEVPGPLPIFGAGAAFAWGRKLRKRIKQKPSYSLT